MTETLLPGMTRQDISSEAYEIGQQAYHEGRSRIGSVDPVMEERVKGLNDQDRIRAVRAWYSGYDAARLEGPPNWTRRVRYLAGHMPKSMARRLAVQTEDLDDAEVFSLVAKHKGRDLTADQVRVLWSLYVKAFAKCQQARDEGKDYVGFRRVRGEVQFVAAQDNYGGRSSLRVNPLPDWATNVMYRMADEGYLPEGITKHHLDAFYAIYERS